MDITVDDYYSFDFLIKVRLSSVTSVEHNVNTVKAQCHLSGLKEKTVRQRS